MTTRSETLRHTLMTGARRQDDDVAGRDFDLQALFAAEAHRGAPARNAHRLVDHRMIVHVRVNAVAPHVAPAVRRERLLDHHFRIGRAGKIDAAAVENERQGGIVRDPAVVGKPVGDGDGASGRGGRHGLSISPQGGPLVLQHIGLILSNSSPVAGLGSHLLELPHTRQADEWAQAARFLPASDLRRRTGVFLSRRAARRRS